MARDLGAALAVDPADVHPGVETQLTAYVDGVLGDEERELVDAHLEVCARCREDVRDLRDVRARLAPRRRPRRWWPAAAAAALAAIAASLFLLLRPHQTVRVAPASPTALQRFTAEALRTHRIEAPPIIRELRLPPEVLRAPATTPQPMPQPSGVVVEDERPTFRWPAKGDSYAVSVFRGDREIARSGDLAKPEWTPDEPLPRGVTLAWEVEARRNGAVTIIPAPPSPPALFRVLDAASAAQLAEARARHPGDHLLLGVLYARAGVQERAIEELRAAHADDLADSVRAW